MNKQINVGVVGCGYWGPNLIRNFRSLPGCNLKLICDLDIARLAALQKLYPGVAAETRLDRMLQDGRLDALVVATSVKHHYPMAKAALEAGKHVLIEKPMAASSAQCEELIELAERQGLILMVGHTFLYSSAVRKIKEIIGRNAIGQIRYICARRLSLGLCQKDINAAWDLAPHDISIILHLLDQQPLTVNCSGRSHTTVGVEDVTGMYLNFANDCSAIVHSSWIDPRKVREMTIVGSKRMLLYDDVAAQEKIRIFDIRVERSQRAENRAEFQYEYHYGDVSCPYFVQEEPLKTECGHFLECIRESVPPLSCGLRGLEVVRILEAASDSLRLGGSSVPITRSKSMPMLTGASVARKSDSDFCSSLPTVTVRDDLQSSKFVESAREAMPCI